MNGWVDDDEWKDGRWRDRDMEGWRGQRMDAWASDKTNITKYNEGERYTAGHWTILSTLLYV